MTEKTFTSISASGVARGKYDTAIFTCTIKGFGPTGPTAKEQARPAIDALEAAVNQLEASGVKIDREALTTEQRVDPLTKYNEAREQVPNGYGATYTLTFKSESVDRASDVHDKLTEVEGLYRAESPKFKLKDLAKLHAGALRDAVRKRDERFADLCAALGVSPDEYVIDTVQAHYDDSESAGLEAASMRVTACAASADAPRAPVKIHAGKSTVNVRLDTSYRKRTPYDSPGVRVSTVKPGTSDRSPAPGGTTKPAKPRIPPSPPENTGNRS